MYQINNKNWNMAFVEPYSEVLKRSDNSFTVGVCDNNTQMIYIADNLQGVFLRKVLLHEVTHSAIFSYGIDMSVEQEEMLCDFLATFGDEIIDVVDNIFKALVEAA